MKSSVVKLSADDSESDEVDIDLMPKEPSAPKPKKTFYEIWKRVAVGFFILSIYILTYYLGLVYMATMYLIFNYLIFGELKSILRRADKDELTGQVRYEWALALFFNFIAPLPQGLLGWQVLNKSGIT